MATQGRRRALGQHFLKDPSVCETIAQTTIDLATQFKCQSVLEIGPGKGAITLPLLLKLGNHPELSKLVLCERDRRIAEEWVAKSHSHEKLKVHSADFLELQEEKWLEPSLMVVSNLPYSSGTAILNRLAIKTDQIPAMVLMFQAEVAHRLRAEPCEKARGSLSLWIQNYWEVKKLLWVPPKAFSPPPEVNSEVVVLVRRSQPLILNSESLNGRKLWESLIKISFSHRRQMLRRVLGSTLQWRNALELSGVDGTKRAESLDWPEWNRLFQAAQQSNV